MKRVSASAPAVPMVASPYLLRSLDQNHTTGSFILIDPITNATVAAGMILVAASETAPGTPKKMPARH
jgi:sulfate adenylyltransferase subunit 1 (EFTu-like GTPase family)